MYRLYVILCSDHCAVASHIAVSYVSKDAAVAELSPDVSTPPKVPYAMTWFFGIVTGLPPAEIPLALLFFNVGVEIGQLLFVAVVLLLI